MRRREFVRLLGAAAAGCPVTVTAQQKAAPLVGFLHSRGAQTALSDRWVAAFQQGLADAGFVVGENVAIQFNWANLQFGQLPTLVSDLINNQAAVIFAANSRSPLRAAKAATDTIPIVFLYGGDPVKDGFVASLSRPGGNMTGLTSMESELAAKRLGLLHEMVPQANTIGFLTERGGNDSAVLEHQSGILAAASSLGLELVKFEVSGPVLARAFATFVERQAGAVLVDNVATLTAAIPTIVRLAQQRKLPTMYPGSAARSGGLMSYSSRDGIMSYHQAASQYVARILKGVKPADLPVQQPTRFELVINLKTARALGLTVPLTLQVIADEVIE